MAVEQPIERDLLYALVAGQLGFAPRGRLMPLVAQWLRARSGPLEDEIRALLSHAQADIVARTLDHALELSGGDLGTTLELFGGRRALGATLGGTATLHGEPVAMAETLAAPDGAPGGPTDATPLVASGLTDEPPDKYRYDGAKAEAEIGRGGIGRVLMAFDSHVGRQIALKELLPAFDGPTADTYTTGAATARFVREARVTGQLEHPNIVPVYEIGKRPDGTHYYTMKMVRGRTLTDAIESTTDTEARLALLPHYVGLCQAIAYAHSRGVLHRDIKPDNVMVGEFGETVVLDWGIAKVKGLDEDGTTPGDEGFRGLGTTERTMVGTMVGTPLYMSPEQTRGKLDAIDEQSDVWGLGVVLFELLTGEVPYDGSTAFEVFDRIRAGSLSVDPSVVAPDVPEELVTIARKAIRVDKGERYESVRAIIADVEAYLAGRRVGAHDYSAWDLVKRFAKEHRALLASSVSILAIIVVALVTISVAFKRESSALTQANYNIAQSFMDKSASMRKDKELSAASIYAAASLEYNPAHPLSIKADSSFADDNPASAVLRAAALSSIYESSFELQPKLVHRIATPEYAKCVAYSPDGTLLATSDLSATVSLWDAVTGARLKVMHGHVAKIYDLEFSPDGALLATASLDQTVRLWSVAQGAQKAQLIGKHKKEFGVSFSPDGALLAVASEATTVGIWDVATEQEIRVFHDFDERVFDVDFSPDGTLVAAGGAEKVVRIFPVDGGPSIPLKAVHEGWVIAVAFSPDGSLLASGGVGGLVALYETKDWSLEAIFQGHEDMVSELSFSPDGTLLASSSYDKTVKVWNIATKHLECTLGGHTDWVHSVSFSPDGAHLASVGLDERMVIWRLDPGAPLTILGDGDEDLSNIAISPDGASLAIGTKGAVEVWDVASASLVYSLAGAFGDVYDAVFVPGTRMLASVAYDAKVRLWDLDDGSLMSTLEGHTLPLQAVAATPDGATLATAGDGGEVILWDVATKASKGTITGHEGTIWDLAVSPSGSLLAAGGDDAMARLYDLGTMAHVLTVGKKGDQVYGVAFSPDGDRLLTAGQHGVSYLWDVHSGALVQTFPGHGQFVWGVAFSPDGTLIATTSGDRTVKLWSKASGEPIMSFSHSVEGAGVGFSPDGSTLAVVFDHRVTMYPLALDLVDASPSELLAAAEAKAGLVLQGSKLVPAPPTVVVEPAVEAVE